jgi:hypothetical protein
MPIAGPDLISCSATVAESLVVPAVTMSDARVFIDKNHKGNPWRELEMFTLTDARSLTGPLFFNLDPVRVEILDQSFQLISGVNISADIVRFYYNPGAAGLELRTIDLDVELNTASAHLVLPFEGSDPFIMDARTVAFPTRLYLVYINAAGNNAFRISLDDGISWDSEVLIDDFAATDHLHAECNFDDPTGAREEVQVLQRRGT